MHMVLMLLELCKMLGKWAFSLILIVIKVLKEWDGYILRYKKYKISNIHIHSYFTISDSTSRIP